MRQLFPLLVVAVVAWIATHPSLPPVFRNGLAPLLAAQVRPVYDRGAAGLTQVLQRLQTTASALHTGAHPDDEDSAFIARTARGDHARVAYLSLTRGEGGQNVIGSELFEALGIIRTEELLQARRLDGGEQFFTRAIDFGFSKTRAESAAKWNERDALDDMVRVIRMFRPQVIVSRFAGTEADGHGHHQLAGYLTPLAFRAAGRADEFAHQFAEGLRPWQAKKLYRTLRQSSEPGLVEVITGALDPAIGRTYAEIAAEGRSQHKSQEMGAIEPRGDLRSYLRLIMTAGADGPRERQASEVPRELSMFEGIETTLPGIARLAGLPDGSLQRELQLIANLARQALEDYEPLQPARVVPVLAAGLGAVRTARAALKDVPAPAEARAEADFLLARKESDVVDALARAAGIVIDALSDQETVPQGSSVTVAVRAFYPDRSIVRVVESAVAAPREWTVARAAASNAAIAGNERPDYSQPFVVSVPAGAAVTEPYFLSAPRDGDKYRWTDAAPKAAPFDRGPLVAAITMEVAGVPITLETRVEYRFADRVRGEIRRNVEVVPPITVAVDSPLLIVPIGGSNRHRVTVTTTSQVPRGQMSAQVRLQLPPGWTSTPPEATFTLGPRGERNETPFVLNSPARPTAGRADILVAAATGGASFSRDMQVIAYPHIDTHRLYRPATVTAQVIDLKVAPVSVGYVMGSGDQVPDALKRMGIDVTLIDNETLARGDLSRFDSIVVGIRASEARPDFPAEHARLMQYVTRGGTLIVQYQQTDYVTRNLPPYPGAAPGGAMNSRVTDETAPVTILAPAHPVFTFPNRITSADFDGWVQERNLYAFPLVDSRYTPLLATADPGEPIQRGGEVYAEVGKGRYVYTAFSWFRQLPAGVPGAYRQFANLISLSKAPR
jgi:LmbE family N-acetylglucosaminyl deacetylase